MNTADEYTFPKRSCKNRDVRKNDPNKPKKVKKTGRKAEKRSQHKDRFYIPCPEEMDLENSEYDYELWKIIDEEIEKDHASNCAFQRDLLLNCSCCRKPKHKVCKDYDQISVDLIL